MTTAKRPEYVVDFPTLWIVPDWIEHHCTIPDGFQRGKPFELYDWQLWATVNHYRVKPKTIWRPERPILAPAFHNRRSQVVAPQKSGKGPWSASIVAVEAAGPVVFAGWATGGEIYDCEDHGCGCGWVYEYDPGEPMGMRWPKPMIQLMATAEDQVDNVFGPLQEMIRSGPLGEQMRVGEEFIRIFNGGEIAVVTSSASARLGNPIHFAMQDETGLYNDTNKLRKVAETMRRGLAGMGGRSMETTNPWDPSEDSVAQRTYESKVKDVFKLYEPPPRQWSFKKKAERRKILAYVYAGCTHVDINGIEAEALELMEEDPGQAERFYGNRIVYGHGAWLEGTEWEARKATRVVEDGTAIVLGFDGSDTGDWTAIRAETQDGYQFTPTYGDGIPTIWNPVDHGGQIPRLEVAAAVDELFERYTIVRMYCDPWWWSTEIDNWSATYGDDIVFRWATGRITQMHAAAERLHVDVTKDQATWTHDGCETTATHVDNARKAPRTNKRYVLEKASPTQKIDAAVTSIICHEAACDATAGELWPEDDQYVLVM
ncbi:hypothetical protein [Glycomyces tarimensis]